MANEIIITNKELNNFKKLYTTTANNNMELARKAYELDEKDAKEFRKFCINELHMSKGNVSKIITTGEILTEMERVELTTGNYTNVYRLNPVKEQLEDYADFVGRDVFPSMTNKEVEASVKEFFGEDENDEAEEATEEDETEVVADQTELKSELAEVLALIESASFYNKTLKADIIERMTNIVNTL